METTPCSSNFNYPSLAAEGYGWAGRIYPFDWPSAQPIFLKAQVYFGKMALCCSQSEAFVWGWSPLPLPEEDRGQWSSHQHTATTQRYCGFCSRPLQ